MERFLGAYIYDKDVHVRVISSNNATTINNTKPQSACNSLAYKGYGCYCGFFGYVIDGIDQCCKTHDWCYDATECLMFSEYFVPYYWRCYHGYKSVCAIEHGSWGGSGSCAQRLCKAIY
ncbi:Phospholipase A(2) [Temnothorax longispinosus]|uniref:Phospholipase A(2) n=1 Tax=Temnothorax longispinosus TaxID=300112 RepID=A0A4S2L253_9HYME|nr:Phospholipase A(2) [Temnothorax longispinosus]